MKTGIVIVSYNTRDLLRECLRSVFAKTMLATTQHLDFRIVVADNGSTDGSPEMLREEFPGVIVVETSGNIGFGRANNAGVAALDAAAIATGEQSAEYLFFLNPDTLLINNAVKILADFLDAHPAVGIAGGNLYAADGVTPAQSFSPQHGLEWELLNLAPNFIKRLLRGPEMWFNYGIEPRRVGYISGADLMVRRSMLDPMRGSEVFDPDFFMYYEDMELCVRVRRLSGAQVMSVPDARIVHLAGQSCTVSRRKFAMLQDSKYIYYRKIRGAFYTRLVYHFSQAGYRFHALLGLLTLNIDKREQYAERAALNREAWQRFKKSAPEIPGGKNANP